MDERDLHDDESENTQNDSQDTENDDETTSDDTNDDGERSQGEKVKEQQKIVWLNNLRSGKRKLDEMPANLGWLKKELVKENPDLQPGQDEEDQDETTVKVKSVLKKERDSEDMTFLADYLEKEVDEDRLADIKEEYQFLVSEGLSPKAALITAMKGSGIKDTQTIIAERRRSGMLMPPQGNQRRRTLKKDDGNTDMERKFLNNLPPGFKPNK